MIRALPRATPAPDIIFSPERRPAVLVRLHTADDIRLASTVQEAQCTTAAWGWTRIKRFPMCEKEDPVALVFVHRR